MSDGVSLGLLDCSLVGSSLGSDVGDIDVALSPKGLLVGNMKSCVADGKFVGLKDKVMTATSSSAAWSSCRRVIIVSPTDKFSSVDDISFESSSNHTLAPKTIKAILRATDDI